MESDAPLEQWRARIVHCSEPTEPQEILVYVERVIFARKPSALRFLAHLSDCEENYERGQCGCNDYAISPLGAVANVIAARDCIAVEIAPPGGLFQHEAVERVRVPLIAALSAALAYNRACKELGSIKEEWLGGRGEIGLGQALRRSMAQRAVDDAHARLKEAFVCVGVEEEG